MNEQLLDELVPRFDGEAPDWRDVVRRARPHRRRKALAAAAVLAAAGAVAATPARSLVLDLIGRHDVDYSRARPARYPLLPAHGRLAHGVLLVPWARDAERDKARLAAVVAVGGGQRRLVIVPRSGGGFCYQFAPFGGGCFTAARPTRGFLLVRRFLVVSKKKPGWSYNVSGTIFSADAARLTLQFEDGTSKELGFVFVSKPIATGFFAYAAPRSRRVPGHRPHALVLRDRNDRVIQRTTLPG